MEKKRFKINSIGTKLVIMMVSLSLIPLVILGMGSYSQSNVYKGFYEKY